MRDQKKVAKRPELAQTGWCWYRDRLKSVPPLDQHHPGRSSAEEGSSNGLKPTSPSEYMLQVYASGKLAEVECEGKFGIGLRTIHDHPALRLAHPEEASQPPALGFKGVDGQSRIASA